MTFRKQIWFIRVSEIIIISFFIDCRKSLISFNTTNSTTHYQYISLRWPICFWRHWHGLFPWSGVIHLDGKQMLRDKHQCGQNFNSHLPSYYFPKITHFSLSHYKAITAKMKTSQIALTLVLLVLKESKADKVTSCIQCESFPTQENSECIAGTGKGSQSLILRISKI